MFSLKNFASLLLCLFVLASCNEGDYSPDTFAVRQRTLDGKTIGELVDELAGRSGKVTWLSEPWDAKQSEEVIRVTATIRKELDGIERELILLYRFDKISRDVVLDQVLFDGQVQSVTGGAMAMLAMKLE
ncbi:hypothetical protein O4H49_12285 [Kiloniella laminariae]|uniref:Uncharacterized protein n=1 Tax=Kiloniella laminariae TaxID=454162 RepID=A0ABT4LNP0_9PROT|nr:hypothetical protein [Kiloniella laminariae]MCZ4281562.1 hypothetical protein [Kiloniella laminariae]